MRLRELRNALGLTVEEVGEKLLCSATKISRLETGSRRASLRDVRDLCRLYDVNDEAQAGELMELARQAREPGWWARFDEPILSPLLGLEQEAVAITAFSMFWVPALLQTAEYARPTIRSIEKKIDPAVLEQRIEARLLRQQLLDQPVPPRYRALLDEAVLHRRVGGPPKRKSPFRSSRSTPVLTPAPTATSPSSSLLQRRCSSPLCSLRACTPTATRSARSRSRGTARPSNTCVTRP
jgi:transcriptional regulator with XRE-family HTH domain